VAVGHLRPIIFRTFPLDQVGQAHALVSSRDVFGRVVLEV
jgi:NADPH:quinone reductase-like Zn-dependent oxidoreductase